MNKILQNKVPNVSISLGIKAEASWIATTSKRASMKMGKCTHELHYQITWNKKRIYGIMGHGDKIRKSTTRSVRFGFPCWSNISRQEHCLRFESLHKQDRSCLAWMILVDQNISKQEHLIEIRITSQARLIMSSLNDSTCNLNYIELQRNLVIG